MQVKIKNKFLVHMLQHEGNPWEKAFCNFVIQVSVDVQVCGQCSKQNRKEHCIYLTMCFTVFNIWKKMWYSRYPTLCSNGHFVEVEVFSSKLKWSEGCEEKGCLKAVSWAKLKYGLDVKSLESHEHYWKF
jgi:hypothetical protein